MIDPKKIEDLLAESACLVFLFSGEVNAAAILENSVAQDYVGMNGATGKIYEAATRLKLRGSIISVISLSDELEMMGALKEVGGRKALSDLTTKLKINEDGRIAFGHGEAILLADAVTVARIVAEKSARRKISMGSALINNRLSDPDEFVVPELARRILPKEFIDLVAASGFNSEVAKTALQILNGTTTDLSFKAHGKTEADDFEYMRARFAGEIVKSGKTTGLEGLDEVIGGGFNLKEIMALGAPTKQCKTGVALHIVNHYVRNGRPAAIICLEADSIQYRSRRVAMNSGRQLPFYKVLNPEKMSLGERDLALDVLHHIRHDPLIIIDDITDTDEQIRALDSLIRTEGIELVLFDYIQRGLDNERDISKRSVLLTNLIARHGIALVACNQHNEEGRAFMKTFGYPSNDYSYLSKQIIRDSTLSTVVMVEDENFECNCEDQFPIKNVYTARGNTKPIPMPRWPWRPKNGICPECQAAGRDPWIIQTNPVRLGKLIIEQARNARPGDQIDFRFWGEYMEIEEIVAPHNAPQHSIAAPYTVVPSSPAQGHYTETEVAAEPTWVHEEEEGLGESI